MDSNTTTSPVTYSEYALTPPASYDIAAAASFLPSLSQDGHHVAGWNTSSSDTTTLPPSTPVSAGETLFAVWQKNTAVPPQTPQVTPFKDVLAGAPFAADINWLHQQGITNGYPGDLYKPGNKITREATIAFLYREAHPGQGDAPAPAVKPFTDVLLNSPFAGDIVWAKAHGVTNGYADGTFRPAGTITREAVTAFLYRADHAGNDAGMPTTAPFRDVPVTNTVAGDIARAKDVKITNGYEDGTFRPDNKITREAVAAFLHRPSTE
jgi:hypothetical protein